MQEQTLIVDIRRWTLSRRGRFVAAGAAAVVVAAGVGAALAGRDGGEGEPVEPAAQPATDARAAAVIRDYQAYWSAYLKAADPADPASAGLAAHASGAELTRVRSVLTARRRAGEVVRGAYQHQETVVSIAAAEATLLDCLAPRTAVYTGAPRKLKFRDPARPQPLAVTLRLVGGTWKVASIRPGDARVVGCAG